MRSGGLGTRRRKSSASGSWLRNARRVHGSVVCHLSGRKAKASAKVGHTGCLLFLYGRLEVGCGAFEAGGFGANFDDAAGSGRTNNHQARTVKRVAARLPEAGDVLGVGV